MSVPAGFLDAFFSLCRQYGVSPQAASDEIAILLAAELAAQTRAWVKLQSGRRIDLVNPTPLDFEPEDLAHGQSITARWGGNTIHGEPLSDAQHALLTLEIARTESRTGLAPAIEMALLIHDGSEGGLGINFDPISPVKPFIGAPYRALDARLQNCIHMHFGLPASLPAPVKKFIKEYDRKAAAGEALHIAGWARDEIRTELKLPRPIKDDPLARRYGCEPWKPWDRAMSRDRFLDELKRIQRRMKAEGRETTLA